ncbi:monocarboxylate transporter 13-like [Uloborus diversus]|uniref:monocarboxylate transporter 13-like n=1 Tax=Uloborus diversus TaxID=327109 RepID=UPI002409BD15|nr:monocarboxylate transporter 13-like [Uloborus diversus]
MDGPDGGGAWFVALSACLINFIMAGLGRMAGIIYIAFMDRYRTDRQGAATPFAVRSSTRSLLGPAVGILGQKYGVRAVTVTGGVIGTLGAAACFFAPDMIWVSILWGGINGLGTALTTTLPLVVIEQYFKKHRTTASGMAFSGGCIGAFLFPALLEKLLLSYGLEGTFLILAGIVMHTIPAAMILRKPPWLRKGKQNKNGTHKPLHKKNSDVYEGLKPCDSYRGAIDGLENDINTDCLKQNVDTIVQLLKLDIFSKHSSQRNLVADLTTNGFCSSEIMDILKDIERLYFHSQAPDSEQFLKPGDSPVRNNIRNRLLVAEIRCKKSQSFHLDDKPEKFQTICTNVSTPDISKIQRKPIDPCILLRIKELCNTNESKILSLYPECRRKEISLLLKEIRKLNKLSCSEEKQSFLTGSFCDISGETLMPVNTADKTNAMTLSIDNHPNTFRSHFKTALKLHKNPLFLLICVCRAVHFITFVPTVTVIVDFSIDQGLPADEGKYVIGALSAGDLLGRLCLGWITDYGFIGLPKYMMFVMILQGMSTASLPMMHDRNSLYANLVVFGALQGSIFIRHSICISKYLESHEQSIAMGCMNFFSGLLGFLLPLYIGYFRDTIESYDCIFFINGCIGFLVGLLWIFVPSLLKANAMENKDVPEAV